MKKIIYLSVIFALTLGFLPTIPAQAEAGDMLHFIMEVKWGNVQGEVTNREEANYAGTITAEDGLVSLINTKKFDRHTSLTDKILTRYEMVSWSSLIYGHWDGVRVLVSAPSQSTVLIDTNSGSVQISAQDLYDAEEEIVSDMGEGREIVLSTNTIANRSFLAYIYWGGGKKWKDCDGTLTAGEGHNLELIKTLRFEGQDEIISQSSSSINWNSGIAGGRDGILVKFTADEDATTATPLTVSFESDDISWQKEYSMLELVHRRHTKEKLTMADGSTGYKFIFHLARRPNRELVKAEGDPKVYLIEDDTKKWIPSEDVFNSQKLDWSEITTLEEAELESYPTADALSYPEGSLIKGAGPRVYVVSDERIRPVTSETAFTSLGYDWSKIKTVPDVTLDEFTTGEDVTATSDHPEGSLIRPEGSAGVYLVEGGQKKPITSRTVFEESRYDWDRVIEVDTETAAAIDTGTAVTYPDGTVIKGEGPAVYVVDKGEVQHVETEEDFTSGGLEWDEIVTVTDEELDGYETGSEFIAD